MQQRPGTLNARWSFGRLDERRSGVALCSLCLFRGECTDTLRRRITELETECKKLTMDIKLKEDQIRELELKVQVKMNGCST